MTTPAIMIDLARASLAEHGRSAESASNRAIQVLAAASILLVVVPSLLLRNSLSDSAVSGSLLISGGVCYLAVVISCILVAWPSRMFINIEPGVLFNDYAGLDSPENQEAFLKDLGNLYERNRGVISFKARTLQVALFSLGLETLVLLTVIIVLT